jgi:hypothetical protein
MTSKGILTLSALAGALLAGCQTSAAPGIVQGRPAYSGPNELAAPVTSATLDRIRIGMAKAEVQSILGKPDSTSAQANAEYMVYYLDLPYHVDSYRTERPYIIRLFRGKVESFGSYFELLDLYTRPLASARPGQPGLTQPASYPGSQQLPPSLVQRGGARPAVDLVSELGTLGDLRGNGVLTGEEFQSAKARLLALP